MTNINSRYEKETHVQNYIMRSILFILLGIFAIYYLEKYDFISELLCPGAGPAYIKLGGVYMPEKKYLLFFAQGFFWAEKYWNRRRKSRGIRKYPQNCPKTMKKHKNSENNKILKILKMLFCQNSVNLKFSKKTQKK